MVGYKVNKVGTNSTSPDFILRSERPPTGIPKNINRDKPMSHLWPLLPSTWFSNTSAIYSYCSKTVTLRTPVSMLQMCYLDREERTNQYTQVGAYHLPSFFSLMMKCREDEVQMSFSAANTAPNFCIENVLYHNKIWNKILCTKRNKGFTELSRYF